MDTISKELFGTLRLVPNKNDKGGQLIGGGLSLCYSNKEELKIWCKNLHLDLKQLKKEMI